MIIEIIKYYDTNKYDLEIYSNEYENWKVSWDKFTETLNEYSNFSYLTQNMKTKLGSELQEVKDKTQDLISIVRKKY